MNLLLRSFTFTQSITKKGKKENYKTQNTFWQKKSLYSWLIIFLSITNNCHILRLTRSFLLLQFSFSFVETHTVKAVKLRPRTQGRWADEVSEENEEVDSKSAPIISSEGSYPWNIDGDLLEVPSELYIR